MKRFIVFSILSCLTAVVVMAEGIDRTAALQKAQRFNIRLYNLSLIPCDGTHTLFSLISSKAPVSESMINPRTTISFGTNG